MQYIRIYESVMHTVTCANRCFLYELSDTEKTFLYNVLLSTVRLSGNIAVIISSGIAALLIMGGKTAYSRFKILLKLNESFTCNIFRNSSKKACLIIMFKFFI